MTGSSRRSSAAAASWEPYAVMGIFILALVVRLGYLMQIQASPFFTAPIGDAGWHDVWARELIRGGWSYQGVFFRAPLYPYFLSVIYSLSGGGYFVARLVQTLLGSMTCVLVYALARHLFDRKAALIAGVATALYGVLVYFDAELLIPVLIVFLNLAMLWLLVRPWPKRDWLRWMLAGLALGLSALARPNILVLVPFLALWPFLERSPGKRRQALSGLGIFCLIAAIIILPVWLHNYRAGDGGVVISSQAGINFYIGNGQEADGKVSAPPGGVEYDDSQKDNVWASSERLAQQEMGRRLKPSEVSVFWFRKAWTEIGQEPRRWFSLMVRKLYYLVNGHEIESNLSIYTSRKWSWLLSLLVWKNIISFPYGLLFPLTLVGLWLSRAQWRKHFLLYLFLIVYGLSVVAFFVNGRFRVPLVPVMIIYASQAVIWTAAQLRSGRWRALPGPALLLAAALLLSNSRLFAVDQINLAREHYQQAVAYERQGQVQRAAEQYQRCLSIDPYTVQAYYNLARIYRQAGDLDTAIFAFQKAVALKPDFAEGYNGLGIAYAQRGDRLEAIGQFRQVIALQPDHGWAYLNLANIYYEMEIADSALVLYRRARGLLPEVDYIDQQIAQLEGRAAP